MPAPATYEYSAAVLIDAHTGLLALIDAGAGAAKIKLYSEADQLLATIILDDPAGTVDGTTGQLTLTAPAPAVAVATDVCTYGVISDSDDTVILTGPTEEGSAAVSGKIVLSTLTVTTGEDVVLIAAAIG